MDVRPESKMSQKTSKLNQTQLVEEEEVLDLTTKIKEMIHINRTQLEEYSSSSSS